MTSVSRGRLCGEPFPRHVEFDRGCRFCFEGSGERSSVRFTWWCMWRNARHGLRGVRVGEASHPGLPRVGLRRLRTCATTIDSVCPTEADSEATLSAAPVTSGIHQRRIPSSDSVPLRGNRFAVLGEPEAEVEVRPRRRLVLVSQHSNDRQPFDEWDSDTDTVGGVSDAELTEVVKPIVEEVPVLMDARVRAPARAFTIWMQSTPLTCSSTAPN